MTTVGPGVRERLGELGRRCRKGHTTARYVQDVRSCCSRHSQLAYTRSIVVHETAFRATATEDVLVDHSRRQGCSSWAVQYSLRS